MYVPSITFSTNPATTSEWRGRWVFDYDRNGKIVRIERWPWSLKDFRPAITIPALEVATPEP